MVRLDAYRNLRENLLRLVGSISVPVYDDIRMYVLVKQTLCAAKQFACENDGSRGPVAYLVVLSLGNFDEHLGRGMLHIDFLYDSSSIVRDHDVSQSHHQHLVHASWAHGRPDCLGQNLGSHNIASTCISSS